ncbi:hypothetical protein [Streptomyces sp. NPDC127108]|uniref:hypothetical protein n=1 Tax=Streptomyces sp. NPDC127108 TaxID=3345361 RepID=UPI0036328CBD
MPSASKLPSDGRRSRAKVIDSAWRGLGAEAEPGAGSVLRALSGPGGAPLTRTVKLIVLPLIVRPALHPELAADFLGPREADRLDSLIRDSGAVLVATAQWFTLLKKARRTLGIVAGNPQDLYFQRCFELATEHGAPTAGADAVARAVVEDVADVTGGRTVAALREHLADAGRCTRLDEVLTAAWEAGRADLDVDADVSTAIGLAAEVLEVCGANGTNGTPDQRPRPGDSAAAFATMVRGGHGSLFGRVLRTDALGRALRTDALGRALRTDTSGVWGRADVPTHLGLTAHPVPPRPEVGRSASTATLPAPLDRTLFERLFTVLQTSTHRDELPTVPELVRREVGRSCAPLGLYDESLRVVVLLGGRLAVGLDPLGCGGGGVGGSGGASGPGAAAVLAETAAHRIVNSRWQREASVLRARRMTVSPRPDPDGGPLEALAHDLRTPWSAYMRRLWVRLHGRDVRDAALADAAAAWAVLDGVARSVMMDHRARVRAALRALSSDALSSDALSPDIPPSDAVPSEARSTAAARTAEPRSA